jgi:hypothetical protein
MPKINNCPASKWNTSILASPCKMRNMTCHLLSLSWTPCASYACHKCKSPSISISKRHIRIQNQDWCSFLMSQKSLQSCPTSIFFFRCSMSVGEIIVIFSLSFDGRGFQMHSEIFLAENIGIVHAFQTPPGSKLNKILNHKHRPY